MLVHYLCVYPVSCNRTITVIDLIDSRNFSKYFDVFSIYVEILTYNFYS